MTANRDAEEIRLQLFANAIVKASGNMLAACAEMKLSKNQGHLLLKKASALGLLATRMKAVMGRWDVDIAAVVNDLLAMRAGLRPTSTRVLYDKKGKVRGREEIFSPLRANELLAKMAGALEDRGTADVGLRLSILLSRAIANHEELRKEEMATGKVPLGLMLARARAELLARPIKEIRAAIEAEATVIPPAPTQATPPPPTPSESKP